jgi:hypothetical protein
MVPLTRKALCLKHWSSTLTVALIASTLNAAEPLPATVEFNRDIRPILSDTCFHCHGPDKAKRKADLRFDDPESVLGSRGGAPIIVPGNLAKSELYRRITAASEKDRMPPVRSGRQLTERQIALLARWIEQGAKWQKHWSLIPPVRPTPPPVADPQWTRNPIDSFIRERLQREGLAPSPEADRATLIRRVTFDLTGLPPTLDEVDAFLSDSSPAAYEKVVNRLLQSPRYGERMAVRWLDGARYADTNGYQSDGDRTMWRWRDWVIEAFNHNMPFDRFTIEQLAGDLLPGATLDQKIATAFNRNHRGNAEGGIIPEEYAVEYVVDRVDTTATVWLGLTVACARCHDHKYDPIKQQEFYRIFAYFNNVPEKGRAIKYGNSPPTLVTPTRQQQAQKQQLEQELAAAVADLARCEPALAAAQAAWEKTAPSGPLVFWSITDRLVGHFELNGSANNCCNPRLQGKFQDGSPTYVPGRSGHAADFDGRRFFNAGDVGDFGFYDKFSCAAWIFPRGTRGGTIVSRMTDAPQGDGYSLCLEDGKLQVNLVKRWLDDATRVQTERRLTPLRWHHVLMTYDGSRLASGIKVYIDGHLEKLQVNLDELNQTFKTAEPLRIGAGGGPAARFRGHIQDVRIYDRALTADEALVIATPESVTTLAEIADAHRSRGQAAKLRAYFLQTQAPEAIRKAHHRLVDLRRRYERFLESLPTTMIMEEMPAPRQTCVLIRGQYDKPGARVSPGVPASLSSLRPDAPANRLGLARWLMDPANPLTARVAVNRAWQMVFGTGLVKTVDDFGSQGESPSHPELLDWLATEFVRSGWDIKALLRTIVTSATYRQSSRVSPTLGQRDPENRLLARGPRFRLSAEMVRDQALATSGLLVERLGGPSVKPYQPDGLWKELTGAEEYVPDKGANLYRRSLYTFWKRTVAPPAMLTFDAAGRETCIVRETRTNTPLQALTLMNDVTYVEAARVLAQRLLMDRQATPDDRLTRAFRLATARPPQPVELQILRSDLQDHLARYRVDRQAALRLVSTGESRRDETLDVGELAAYTVVAGLILNLDETITKE